MNPVHLFLLTAVGCASATVTAEPPVPMRVDASSAAPSAEHVSITDPASVTDSVSAADSVVWRGAPIRVNLRLKTERTIRVPGAQRLRSGLLGGPVPGLRIQSLGDHIYLLAEQPFAGTRLLVQSDRKASILLDLAADKTFAAGGPLTVLTSGSPAANVGIAPVPSAMAGTTASNERPIGYVALVRHGAQSLYAPARLIPGSDHIVRAPLDVRDPVDLVRGAHIEAIPVAAWRAQGPQSPLWVTAVKLRNRLDRPVVLDPRDLRGHWRAASFQHARLSAAGAPTDTTTVYLVAERRFAEALGPFAAPLVGRTSQAQASP